MLYGLVQPPSPSLSLLSCASMHIGLSLSLRGKTLQPTLPDGIVRSDQSSCLPASCSISFLSASVLPWYSLRFVSHTGCGQTGPSTIATHSILRPRFQSLTSMSQLGCSQPEHVSAAPTNVSRPGCGQTEHDSPLTLDIKFINSACFLKYLRNNPCAALWYHPEGSRGYSIAAASFR